MPSDLVDKKEKQRKLVGNIIFANFIQYPLEKFINFITEVEGLPLYEKLASETIISRKALPCSKILKQSNARALARVGVIAEIKKGVNFSICYTRREFSLEYQINHEKLRRSMNNLRLTKEEEKNTARLLNKLRRINTRNLMVHEILKGIVEHQRDYLESNNELDLKPFTRVELARIISHKKNGHGTDFMIDPSRISRVLQGLSIITPQGKEVSLSCFFATRKDMAKRYIKVLLIRERQGICEGRRKIPYTDEELRIKLNDEYNLSITRRQVAYCRKDLGILPYSRRNGYVYRTLVANFSQIYPFTVPSVKNNAPARPGIYELRLNGEVIEYPTSWSQIFYIGSGKNLKKRLLSHLSSSSKNGDVRRFAKEKSCVFRYLGVPRGWAQEEEMFYNLFMSTYGDSPLCNHASPKRRKPKV